MFDITELWLQARLRLCYDSRDGICGSSVADDAVPRCPAQPASENAAYSSSGLLVILKSSAQLNGIRRMFYSDGQQAPVDTGQRWEYRSWRAPRAGVVRPLSLARSAPDLPEPCRNL